MNAIKNFAKTFTCVAALGLASLLASAQQKNVIIWQGGTAVHQHPTSLVDSITVKEAINVPVTGVTIAPSNPQTLSVSESFTAVATVAPENATNKAVTWSSSADTVATVTSAGLVTAVGVGTATITATSDADNSKTASVDVTVSATTIAVTGVSVSPTDTTLYVGDTFSAKLTVAPTDATNKAVTWGSSNSSVATVAAAGLVEAVAPGSAVIIAATADGGKIATVLVTVSSTTVAVTGVTVSATVPEPFTVGDTLTFTATVTPTDATNKTVTWSSSDPAVATVDASSGLVTAESAGTATITATAADGSSVYGALDITVSPAPATLTEPAANAKVILSNALEGDLTFRWTAKADATSYTLIVAKDADLTQPVYEQSDITETSYTVSEANVQALIADASNGLKRYKKNPLYWGVKVGSELIDDEARPLTLYGQRIYVDDRKSAGSETYPVAVIEYNGKEVVWMAEDLRATKSYDSGFEMGVRTETERATYDNGEGVQDLPEKYLNRPADAPVGKYYDGQYLVNFIPRGHDGDGDARLWRMPTTDDWNELFKAAWETFGNDNALRHPDFLQTGNTDHANEWGMNMVPNGYFSYYGSGTHQIWYDSRIYYQNKNDASSGEGATTTIYEYNYWDAGDGNYGKDISNGSNGNNIRCIYTGDGE